MFDTTEWPRGGVLQLEIDRAPEGPTAGIRSALGDLSGDDLSTHNGDTLSGRLIELLEVRERLDAELTRTGAAWHRGRCWEADGALSPVAWLTHRAPLARWEANRLVKSAKVIDESPRLADAMGSGATTAKHIDALAAVMSPRRRHLLAEHEEVLAEQAEQLSIKDFTVLARRWAAIADDHLATDSHDDPADRNELYAAVTMDGWIDGRFHLDPIAGARLVESLDHIAPPDSVDAPDGARSLAQRRGDALADLAGWYHQGDKPTASPPSLDVVVDVATLNGNPPSLAQTRCDLDGVGPITKATLDQIGCSATLRRLVMAGDSITLDMGRKVRFATSAQARAVRIRDKGCVFPSCGRTAQWCDIHHIDDFATGGHTDIARMCCLCLRHHTLIHNSRWTIEISSDGTFTFHHPARAP